MVRCPSCESEITAPVKTWPIPSRKSADKREGSKMVVGMFECPNCKTKFRAAVKAETLVSDRANLKDMVDRIKGIKGELMQTLKNLREKIKTLETERSTLMIEIDELRKAAETRATALESEVAIMREEVQSLRDILGIAHEEME